VARILLSSVTFPTTSYYQGPHNDAIPHIGLASLAAVLAADGHEVRHIEPVASGWSLRAAGERIGDFNPDIVGFSCYTQDMDNAARLAAILKTIPSRPTIVVGGYHPTALPGKTLAQYPDFDGVIVGEGERSMLEFVRARSAKSDLSAVPGLVFRNNGDIVSNRPGIPIDDLDALPYPQFDGLPLIAYREMYSCFKGLMLPINNARGCPNQCIFCHRMFGNRVRFRSAESVVGEMKRDIAQYGAKNFAFVAETFTVDPQRTAQLCEAIVAAGLQREATWFCGTRIDAVTRDLLGAMGRAGCRVIGFGIESGVQETLDVIKKGIDLTTAKEVFSWCRRAGIRATALFILGHPHDTVDRINATMRFAVAAKPTYVIYAILTPYPGTEIARMAARGEGGMVLRHIRWAAYGKSIGDALELKNVDHRTLERLQRKAYLLFYFRPTRIRALFEVIKLKVLLRYAWHVFLFGASRRFSRLRRRAATT